MRAFEVLSLFTMTVSPTLRSLGFTYAFLSAYCFIFSLGFGVTLPNAEVFSNGCDQVWEAVFYGPAK